MRAFFAELRRPLTMEDKGALRAWYFRIGRLYLGVTLNICIGAGFSVYRDCEGDWCAGLQLGVVGVHAHFWWR